MILVVGGWYLRRGRTEEIRPSYQHRSLEADDKSGRSVVIEDEGVYYFREKGVVETEIGGEKQVVAVAGRFAGWEELPESGDRLLKLTDIETGEELPAARVVFGSGDGAMKPTVWRVVDLGRAGSVDFDQTVAVVGRLSDLTEGQLSRIIRAGDVIRADIDFDSRQGLRDEEGRWVANYINLRRWGGRKAVEAELK